MNQRVLVQYFTTVKLILPSARPKANVCEVMNLIGDVKGKNVIMLDDMIDTAGTITNAANALKEFGAKDIYACCTHEIGRAHV